MSDIIYRGENGQIRVNNLIITDKSGSGEAEVGANPSGSWTAKGFKTEYEAIVTNTFLFRKDSGKTYSNNGAPGVVQANLPSAPGPGVHFTFVRIASQSFRVRPQGSDAIIYSGGQMTDGEWLELASNGAVLSVVSDSNNNWIATIENGTLTEETP